MKQLINLLAIFISINCFGQIPTDSLLVHYKFNGNAKDLSINGNDGVAYGPQLSSDRFNNPTCAYDFDGVDDYIMSNYDSIIQPQFPFSFSVWFKVDSRPVNTVIFGSGSEAAAGNKLYYGFWIRQHTTGEISIGVGNGNSGTAGRKSKISNNSVANNTWHHAVANFNSVGDYDLFINGKELIGSYIGSATTLVYDTFGVRVGRGGYFDGQVDDIRLYGRTLDTAEVNALYKESNSCGCTDTLYITNTITDTLTLTDTIFVNDTITVHDTTIVHDTISIVQSDTIVIHDTITITDTLILGNGSRSSLEFNVSLYPIPCKNNLNIEYNIESNNASFLLLDNKGVILVEEKLKQHQNFKTFDLSGYPAGNYHYMIKTEQGIKKGKIPIIE